MKHYIYDEHIPESIFTSLFSHLVPKNMFVYGMENLWTFEGNATVFMENQRSLESMMYILPNKIDQHIEENEEDEISKLNTANLLSQFLYHFKTTETKILPYQLYKPQFQIIMESNNNFGMQLCFSIYTHSLSILAFFLLRNNSLTQDRYSMSYAQRAIECLHNFEIPSTFLPNFEIPPLLTIPLYNDEPKTPTSIAISSSTLFVGSKDCIRPIPLYRYENPTTVQFSLPTISEPYSLIYIDRIDPQIESPGRQPFLLFSSPSFPAVYINSTNGVHSKVNISYQTSSLFIQTNSFNYPIISDGQYIYSIDFGSSPRVKIFKYNGQGLLFIRSVQLSYGSAPIKTSFKDLLPIKLRETTSIATNGVFLSVIFNMPNTKMNICRIFRLRDGVHIRDVPLHSFSEIKAWTFDINRPSHCLILDKVMLLIDSELALPPWFIGFDILTLTPNTMMNSVNSMIDNVSYELAQYASHFIGSKQWPSFNFGSIPDTVPLEDCMLASITSKNRCAAQAFLIFLPYKIMNNDYDNYVLLKILDAFIQCYEKDEFEYIRKQIVFVFLSCFDTFALSSNQSTLFLRDIIFSNNYSNLLLRYLPSSIMLPQRLTKDSLSHLVNTALSSAYVFNSDALQLLRQILTYFSLNQNELFLVFMKVVVKYFCKDFDRFLKNSLSEQQFLCSISFNIYKELILAAHYLRNDYYYDLNVIIELFSIGISLQFECGNLICKVIERTLAFVFEICMKQIREDRHFYLVHERTLIPEFCGKNNHFDFDTFSIDSEIVEAFQKVVDDSYTVNLSNESITKEINIIFDKVRCGQLSKTTFLEKCKKVQGIQPQLFQTISFYFQNDIDFKVKDVYESIFVQLVIMLKTVSRDTTIFRTVFIYFISEFYQIRQSFLMVPESIISSFISHFELWYYLPPEFLIQAKIPSYMLNSLSTRSFLACESNLFLIQKSIDHFISQFDEKHLLRSLILLNISKTQIDLESIVPKCLMTGNYEIIRQTMIYINQFIDINHLSVIDTCLEFIGTYLNEEKIMFYYQPDRLACYQNCFLIADHLKTIFTSKIPFDLYLDYLIKHHVHFEQSKSHSENNVLDKIPYSTRLGLLVMMNNSIDTLRMHCRVSAVSSKGATFCGIVAFFDDKTIAIELESHLYEYIKSFNSYNCSYSSLNTFDPTLVKNLEVIKHLIFHFNSKLSFHDIFKFAALNEFMKIEGFRNFFKEAEISEISYHITKSLIPLNKSINDLSQLMIFHMTPLPIFVFNQSDNECLSTRCNPTVETLRNSFFNRTQQKDLKNLEISDTLLSFERTVFYVSTPIHPTVSTRVTFTIHSIEQIEPQFILTICMLGKSSNAFFKSQSLICDSSHQLTIELRPHLHSILITMTDLNDVNIFLQPTCEFIFFTVRLAPSTVVDYTFLYDLNMLSTSTTAEISIPRPCDTEDEFILPFQTSSIFVDAQMKENTSNIVSYFALDMILHFSHYTCTYYHIPFALLHANHQLYDTNVDFYNFDKNKYTNFVEKCLQGIKNSHEKDLLNGFVEGLMNEIESKGNRYKKSAFGPFNMTATIFTGSFNYEYLKSINSYLVANRTIIYNPTKDQLKNLVGMMAVIPLDDITDSIIEFYVRIRHIAAILLYISNSNGFLIQYITRLLKIMNNDQFIASVTEIGEVLNRLIPKHKIFFHSNSSPKLQKKKSQKHGLYYMGISNCEAESKAIFNFSTNPISTIKKVSVSKFSLDDDEDDQNNDSSPALIDPSFLDSNIVLEMEVLRMKDWVCLCFPTFFEDNVDNLDTQIEMFFTMKNSLKCFPFTNFLDQLFYCNSDEFLIGDCKIINDVFYFECSQLSKDEFVYLDINNCDGSQVKFEVSLDLSTLPIVVNDNESLILPPTTFYIKFVNQIDLNNIRIRWKKFIYDEDSIIYNQIQHEVFKWRPCFSHQILQCFSSIDEMTIELYNLLPISTIISYEIARFFFHILKQSPKYLSQHTFDYQLSNIEEISPKSKEILSFIPSLNCTSFYDYQPKDTQETAVIASLLLSDPHPLNYTIPYEYWVEISNTNTAANLLFRSLTNVNQQIDPVYLRMICSNHSMASIDIVLKYCIWKKVPEEQKNWMIDYLKQLKPFLLTLFVECSTGHWGTNSLGASSNPYIIIEQIEQEEMVEFHQSIQLIAIGHFKNKYDFIHQLKYHLHQYIVSIYQ